MKPAVRAYFNPWTDGLEGHLSWMYLDVLGLVTTGRGNLIDPMARALDLPWQRDGELVTREEVVAEWIKVKVMQYMAKLGGRAFATITNLRLSELAIDALCLQQLDAIEAELVAAYPGYSDWPADAQLGILGMCWAMGSGRVIRGNPGFQFPHFESAAQAQDFSTCATECKIANCTVQRNTAHRILFSNAAKAADRDVLYYPRAL